MWLSWNEVSRWRQTLARPSVGRNKKRLSSDRPRKTTPREDRLISRRVRQRPFSTAGALRGNLAFGGHINTRTVIIRLHHQGMRARRPIKRPQSTPKAVVPTMWLSWNEVSRWRQTLARPSVGRNKKRLSSDQWIRLHVRIVYPKWSWRRDNHALDDRPMFMDDNARPHRAWIVQHLFTARGC
jgi:transposase